MPISYSYTIAAERHLADAVHLWTHGTREGAAHLAGMSAECMLKSILVGLGVVAVGADGQIPRIRANSNVRVHVNQLWAEFSNILSGHAGAAYVRLLPADPLLPAQNPFDDWLVDHRYVAANQLHDEQMLRWTWAAIALSEGAFAHAKQQSPAEVQ